MSYTQLSQEERAQIHILKKNRHTQADIAKQVGRSTATISQTLRLYFIAKRGLLLVLLYEEFSLNA